MIGDIYSIYIKSSAVFANTYITIDDDTNYAFSLEIVDCIWSIVKPDTYNKDFYCASDLYCNVYLGTFSIKTDGYCNSIYIQDYSIISSYFNYDIYNEHNDVSFGYLTEHWEIGYDYTLTLNITVNKDGVLKYDTSFKVKLHIFNICLYLKVAYKPHI
jgi:hypothetical protein